MARPQSNQKDGRRAKFNEAEFDALIKLTKLRSETLINALRMHLVEGYRKAASARKYDVDRSLLTRRAKRLENVGRLANKFAGV